MTADAYLPHVVHNVPGSWLFDSAGNVLPKVRHYIDQGVVRIIAGPELAHVVIDLRRPYHRPRRALRIERGET